jgi:hypothetical protein
VLVAQMAEHLPLPPQAPLRKQLEEVHQSLSALIPVLTAHKEGGQASVVRSPAQCFTSPSQSGLNIASHTKLLDMLICQTLALGTTNFSARTRKKTGLHAFLFTPKDTHVEGTAIMAERHRVAWSRFGLGG